MTPELAARVAAVAADNRSGASALLAQAITILEDAQREGRATLESIALSLCAAQPSMASLWNAAAVALRPNGAADLANFATRARRSLQSLARIAADLLMPRGPGAARVSIATVSASESVHRCVQELSRRGHVHVVCPEGRPAYEGRQLAASLAGESVATTFCTDAALGVLLEKVDAVVMGADAISRQWFINKCGSRQVVATAVEMGMSVYVVAGRDKFIESPLDDLLQLGSGPPEEVWDGAPDGVTVANPYFERVPIAMVAGVVTDAGTVGPASVADICASVVPATDAERLAGLIRAESESLQ